MREVIYIHLVLHYLKCLTGTVPFDGDTAVSVAVQHIQDTIPAPSQLVEGYSKC